LKQRSTYIYDSEYLERAGFKLYGNSNTLQEPDESLIVHLIGRGARLTEDSPSVLEGSLCRKVELTSERGRHQFYLDPAMNYALRKYVELAPDGRTRRVTTNRDFVEFADPKIWLPRQSSSAWYAWSSMKDRILAAPLFYEDIRVIKLDKHPMPPETFVMDMKRPGTMVADTRLPGAETRKGGAVQYQVPANLEYLDGVIDSASKGQRFVPPLSDNRWAKVTVALNLVILSAGGIYLWKRSAR
jgi:hypothetical protein